MTKKTDKSNDNREVLQANEFKANALCPGNINLEDVTIENLTNMDVKSETLSKLVNEVGQDVHSNIDHLLANLQKFQTWTFRSSKFEK